MSNLIWLVTALGITSWLACEIETGEIKWPELIQVKEYKVLRGHTERVTGASFSPDGKQVLTFSERFGDKTARLWNSATGVNNKIFHESDINDAQFSPDGQTIAMGNGSCSVKLVAADTGNEIRTMSFRKGPRSCEVDWSSFSPNGKLLASVSRGGFIMIFDPSNGQLRRKITLPLTFTMTAAFSHDSKMIGTIIDNDLQVFNVETGEEHLSAKNVTNFFIWPGINRLAFSKDNSAIVAPKGKDANIIDANTGRVLLTLKGHQDDVISAAYSPDGKKIATASKDKTAKIWDAKTGIPLATLNGHHDMVFSAAFSPDGNKLVTASKDKTAIIWSLID